MFFVVANIAIYFFGTINVLSMKVPLKISEISKTFKLGFPKMNIYSSLLFHNSYGSYISDLMYFK